MPSLPRIRRTPPRTSPAEVVARPRTRLAELHGNGLTWIHLDAPELEEAQALAHRFDWHALDIEDVLSRRQRPKVDDYPEYLFGVLHFPVYDKAIQRLNAAELDFFLGADYLVTLPSVELLPVTRLFQRCYEDTELRASLFSKASGRLPYEVLDDLVDASERIWDLLDNYKEVVDGLEGTNESVISHRLNTVLRILTVVSVIFLPLTLLSGIFGMNVKFPGFGTVWGFWAVAGAM